MDTVNSAIKKRNFVATLKSPPSLPQVEKSCRIIKHLDIYILPLTHLPLGHRNLHIDTVHPAIKILNFLLPSIVPLPLPLSGKLL